jgi:hypothetical protein
LLVSWCAGGRCGMACSDEDRGRSRRPGAEETWSACFLVELAGVGDLVQRRRALSVHHGLEQWSSGGLTSAHARGRSGDWELTASWGKGRGAPGGPHRGYKKGDTVGE